MKHAAMAGLLGCLLAIGCRSEETPRAEPVAMTSVATSSATSIPSAVAASHDHADPPIDCPLRKHGIDPHGLAPFEDVDQYIAFLERPDRAQWQRPDDVVAALGLTGTETVADVGAGSGYFAFRFAKALPKGRVVAIDVEAEMIRHIHHRAMTTGVNNVEVALAKPDDPTLPAGADWVFVCDVLHHVQERAAWLRALHGQMTPGAKLALIEFEAGPLPEGPPESLKIGKAAVIDLVTKAGFDVIADHSERLPYQHMLLFVRR